MNRRKITILTVAAALVLTVALFVSLSISSWLHRPPVISLPPTPGEPADNAQASQPSAVPGAEKEPAAGPLVKVEVTRDNVQEVVATLQRPAACSYTAEVTLFWDNGSAVRRYAVAVKKEVTRVDTYDKDGHAERHTIIGGGQTYIWLPGSPVYEGTQGNTTGDSAAQLPTYEELLTLPPEAILDARYEILEETIPCAYAEVTRQRTGYTARYWVSLETGMLVRSEWFAGERQVYAMTQSEYSEEEPPDTLFTLPGGQLITGVTNQETE